MTDATVMNEAAMNTIQERDADGSIWAAYVELTKIRIAAMVLLTVVVAGFLAAGNKTDLLLLFNVVVGVFFVSASGSALNQYLERYTDFLMPRTAGRPLPDQRLSAGQVASFGAITFGIGIGYLFAAVNWQAGVCGLATWFIYVFVYTPMKMKTAWNTTIGAIAGAMPILMGALATTGTIPPLVWIFFTVLFLWQFPHFMAIAWLYREDYTEGGLKMLTVTDPSGKHAGWTAIGTAITIIPVSLLPVIWMQSRNMIGVYVVLVGVCGLVYLLASFRFARHVNDTSARKLLRVSLLYLPVFMVLLALGTQF
ncbi:heme o synthase [Vicingaceae bacterium]|nr:heme o synthase [Vicingaceae bacterium]